MTTANRLADGPMLPEPPDPGRRRRRRWALRLGVVAALLTLVVAAHGPILAGVARLFRVDDAAPSDVLVVLLGGPGHRPTKAARLYRAGLAPRVWIGTSAEPPGDPRNETEMAVAEMVGAGVPRRAIAVLPGVVESTFDEASRVRDAARGRGVRRITVVTTDFHTRRARWVFRRVLRGAGIDVRVAAAAHPAFDERTWYRSDEGLVLYFAEAIKTVYYWLIY